MITKRYSLWQLKLTRPHQHIRKALYELEHDFDCFDTKIDRSDLKKCFTSTQETKIAISYKYVSETRRVSEGSTLISFLVR